MADSKHSNTLALIAPISDVDEAFAVDQVDSTTGHPALALETTLSTLPNELLLEIMGLLLGMKRKWLATLIRTSRQLYFLGLPLIVRDLAFPLTSPRSVTSNYQKQNAFFENGLDPEKFRFVRKLSLMAPEHADDAAFYIELLRKTAPYLEDLALGICEININGHQYWEALRCPLVVKKLEIRCTVVDRKPVASAPYWMDNVGALFHLPLLEIAKKLETLEELRLDGMLAIIKQVYRDDRISLLWPVAFKDYPNLASKLVEITVEDRDVPEWAKLELPNLKSVVLGDQDLWSRPLIGNYTEWKRVNAFPGLWKLSIGTNFETDRLAGWPLRDLRELHLKDCRLTLQRAGLNVVANELKQKGLRTVIEQGDGIY